MMIFELILEIRWIMEGFLRFLMRNIWEGKRGSIINLESTYPCLYIKFHPFEPKFDFRIDFRTFFHVKFSRQIHPSYNLILRKSWFHIETSHSLCLIGILLKKNSKSYKLYARSSYLQPNEIRRDYRRGWSRV